MRTDFAIRAIRSAVWAIMPEKFDEICAFLEAARIEDASKLAELHARVVGPNDVPRAQTVGTVAVIPVFGTISNRMGLFSDISGGTSAESLAAQIQKAVSDTDISAIVLDVNSPGGTVNGVPELHLAIMSARDSKAIIASVNAMAGSAAYWIASAASSISASPSAEVGSIGVFTAHEDVSKLAEAQGVKVTIVSAGKYKTEGNRFEPLSDEAKESLQSKVNDFYDMFVSDVAEGRGVSSKDVKSGYGEGRMLTAKDAKAAGMIDKVETLSDVLTRLNSKRATAPARGTRSQAAELVHAMQGKIRLT